jgi:hypothetical protein
VGLSLDAAAWPRLLLGVRQARGLLEELFLRLEGLPVGLAGGARVSSSLLWGGHHEILTVQSVIALATSPKIPLAFLCGKG